jgi:DNA-binding NarL/FixJ family response regulator
MALLILMADDDVGMRVAVADYLRHHGYGVVTASTGREALALLHEYHPQMVITDVRMPEMDGYELVREIRQYPPLRLLPVVFLTARDQVSDRVQGYQLGCDNYLAKPFELEELLAIVRNLFDRTQVMQAEWQFQSLRPGGRGSETAIDLPPPPDPAIDLSDRERVILGFLSEGLSNNQIGLQLHLSARTIEKYVTRLFRKTNTNTRAELVRFAVEHHLL